MIKYLYLYSFSLIIGWVATFLSMKITNNGIIVGLSLAFFPGIFLGLFVNKRPFLMGIILTFLILAFFFWLFKFTGLYLHPEFAGDYFKMLKKNWQCVVFPLLCPFTTFIGYKLRHRRQQNGK